MKRLTVIAAILFIAHTLEEGLTSFWTTDWSVQVLSKALSLNPAVFYWLVQIVLYVFLFAFIFLPLKKSRLFLYPIIGVILVFEFHHLWVAITAGAYVSGAYTGTLLGLLGIYFWYAYTKLITKNNL